MNTALLLHSVKEAEYCVQQHLDDGCLLFSTNPGVDVYLKEQYGIECRCVSSFFSHEEQVAYAAKASATVDRVLSSLDERISPVLNEQFGLKMRYFVPLYSYEGKHYLLAHVAFIEAFRKVVETHCLGGVRFFDSRYQDFLNCDLDMKALMAGFFPQLKADVIECAELKAQGFRGFPRLKILLDLMSDPGAGAAFLKKAIKEAISYTRYLYFDENRKTVLFAEPLFYLRFLKDSLPRYNLIRCSYDGYPTSFLSKARSPEVVLDHEKLDPLLREKGREPFDELFLRAVREDFSRGIERYLRPILAVKRIQERHPLSLAIWGNIGGFVKCLTFEYLSSAGVPVVGTQHGNSYVDQVAPWIFDSDLNRCDHFISWGFDEGDMSRAFPDIHPRVEVHPIGVVRPPLRISAKREIDIVFPMSLSASMFNGGAAKMRPDVLTERKIAILRHLDSLKGKSVCVKLFPFQAPEECSVYPVMRKMKNLILVEDVLFEGFLEKYHPKIVIVDYPSAPLFQALHLDSEILLLPDAMSPYEAQALSELKRRVHYCEDADAAIAALDMFFEGRLEKKRDDSYYNHYVYKPDARENTLRLIDRLVGMGGRSR